MEFPNFNKAQKEIITGPLKSSFFLFGEYGTGKTTTGLGRLDYLLQHGIQAQEILILIPQRVLALPYFRFFQNPEITVHGEATIVTLGGIAKRMTSLFWPEIAKSAGFTSPEKPPTFLTLETTQFFMARIVEPLLAQGYFEIINLDRNRLFSQLIDNMNKAAVVGFRLEEIGIRLKDACIENPGQILAFEQAQECAQLFRKYCLENRLLDYSLQIELFIKYLWPSQNGKSYLYKTFKHLIYDNIEEDVPIAHDWIKEWLPEFHSALLINDSDGGYRSFLGADPQTAYALHDKCNHSIEFTEPIYKPSKLEELRNVLSKSILHITQRIQSKELRNQFSIRDNRFFPEMIQSVGETANQLIGNRAATPEDIVILAPYLSDVLRFSITQELSRYSIHVFSTRPSHSIIEESVTKCMLSLAKLAHPDWNFLCSQLDIRFALMTAIKELDIVRADLCARTLFLKQQTLSELGSFTNLLVEKQERITPLIGEKIDQIRAWLIAYRSQEPVPLFGFLSRLFGELLSQEEFAFHKDFESASIVSHLINSVRRFRQVMLQSADFNEITNGRDYIEILERGLLAAQYFDPLQTYAPKAILLSPAFTYLMSNQTVKYQFWLDIGSLGWWERLNQPMTHPYLLNRHWKQGDKWTDAYEYNTNQQTMARLTRGLLRRCSEHVFLFTTGLNEQGKEQNGSLLQAFQLILKHQIKQNNI